MRYAKVTVTGTGGPVEATRIVSRYMPGNYDVLGVIEVDDNRVEVLIGGKDVAGWTLDDYVLPRLSSGLHVGREFKAAWS